MKKIVLFIVFIAMTISVFGQIEIYQSEEVKKSVIKNWNEDKEDILQILKENTKYPITELKLERTGTLLNKKYEYEEIRQSLKGLKYIDKNLEDVYLYKRNYYLYAVQQIYKNLYLIGDTLFSSNDSKDPIIVLSQISNDTITVDKLPTGTYFNVENIIVTQEEKDLLYHSFANLKFKEQKLIINESKSYKLKRKMGGEFIWNRLYDYDLGFIYVLKNNGNTYYITAGNENPNFEVAKVANISNFVSLKSYNSLKDMFLGKELTTFYDYFKSDNRGRYDYLGEPAEFCKVKRITVKENQFVFELRTNKNEELFWILNSAYEKELIKFWQINSWMGSIERLKKEEGNIEGYLGGYDEFCKDKKTTVLKFNEYNSVSELIDKSYADSIIKEWENVVQNKIIELKRENEEYRENIIKKHGVTYGNLILDNKISIGMTQEMCIEAYGSPRSKNKSTTSLGVVEIWTYKKYDWDNDDKYIYVTFVNDKITEIYE